MKTLQTVFQTQISIFNSLHRSFTLALDFDATSAKWKWAEAGIESSFPNDNYREMATVERRNKGMKATCDH